MFGMLTRWHLLIARPWDISQNQHCSVKSWEKNRSTNNLDTPICMLSHDRCLQKEVHVWNDLSANVFRTGKTGRYGSCVHPHRRQQDKVTADGRRFLLKFHTFNGYFKRKWSLESAVVIPGNDHTAKLPVRSAKAIAPNRVGAQDRKTYLHAEQRNRSQQTEYTRHSYAYMGGPATLSRFAN